MESYNDYSKHDRHFISDVFVRDFINSLKDEKRFGNFISSGNVHTVNCLSGSVLIAEHIYGGISPDLTLADIAKWNDMTEEQGQKLYDEFWQKAINHLNTSGGDL